MGATIHQEEGYLRVLRITGLLRKSELDAALEAEAKEWGPATRVRVLIIKVATSPRRRGVLEFPVDGKSTS